MVENTVSTKAPKKTEKYMDADDKNVAALIVYQNPSNNKYYYEATFTNEVPFTAEELFFKDAVLGNANGAYVRASGIANGVIVWGSSSSES